MSTGRSKEQQAEEVEGWNDDIDYNLCQHIFGTEGMTDQELDSLSFKQIQDRKCLKPATQSVTILSFMPDMPLCERCYKDYYSEVSDDEIFEYAMGVASERLGDV